MKYLFKNIFSSSSYDNSVQEQEICSLKEQKQEAMKRLRDGDEKRKETLANYFYLKFKEAQDIPFDVLDAMEEGELLPLPVVHGGAITARKQTVDQDEEIKYVTEWISGSTLTWHFHSDCYEIITINEGKFKVFLPNDETVYLKEGDILRIAVGIGHQVTALTRGKLTVDFIKI